MAAYFEATRLAGFSEAEGLRFFGRPGGIDGSTLDLDPWPAALAERQFLKQFKALQKAVAKKKT